MKSLKAPSQWNVDDDGDDDKFYSIIFNTYQFDSEI